MLSPSQIEARLNGIGGTDAGVILGLSKWKSPYQLWREKRREIQLRTEETDAMEWGTILEPEIAKHYSKRTGRKVRRVKARVHPAYSWMRCNSDRMIVGEARGPGILEIKTVNAFAAREWTKGGVPDVYYAQLQHNLAVHNVRWGAFAILIGGQQPVYFDVERDDAFIAMLIQKEAAFWALVQTGQEPEMDGSDATRGELASQYPKDSGTSILADDLLPTVKELERTKAAVRVTEKEVTRLENVMKAAMGEATLAVIEGYGKVSWKKSDDSVIAKVVNVDLMKSEFPEAFAKYIELSSRTGARVFKLLPETAKPVVKQEAQETVKSLVAFAELVQESADSRAITFDL